GDDLNSLLPEVAQVGFVDIPFNQLELIFKKGRRPVNLLQHFKKSLRLLLVIPRTPDDNGLKLIPVDRPVAPGDRFRRPASFSKRFIQEMIITFIAVEAVHGKKSTFFHRYQFSMSLERGW